MGADAINKHMLSQSCQTTIYEKAAGDTSTNLLLQEARSSQVTTWSASANGVWRPCSTFAWQMTMDANGAVTAPMVNFNFANPAIRDTSWKFKGATTLYNSFGSPIEAIKPLPKAGSGVIRSSVVYGDSGNLPIGQISNAGFYECGAFTCDYDFNDTLTGYFFNYFDKQNGWEKNGGFVVNGPNDKLHFGQKSLKIVNGEGAMRNFKIRANTKYTLSAWVNIDSAIGTNPGFLLYAELRKGAPSVTAWPIPYTTLSAYTQLYKSDSLITTAGKWKLVKVEIPAQAGDSNWIRVTIGRNVHSFTAHVDDIRFGPSNAMISTTYYDTLWQQPVISVDASDNPGKRVTYDGFGRPIKWEKIDPSKSVGETGYAKLMQSKEYHLRNDLPAGKHIQVLYPDGGENFTGASKVSIQWVNDSTRNVLLYYKKKTGNSWGGWTQIGTTLSNQSGWCSYNWTVPTGTANNCKVKAEIASVEADSSDRSFYVSTP